MEEDEKLQQVRRKVQKKKMFYSSVITFVWVNILLLVINLLTTPRSLWFYWITIIWGIVLLAQAINTFSIRDRFIGQDWEDRQINKEMEKFRRNKK